MVMVLMFMLVLVHMLATPACPVEAEAVQPLHHCMCS